MRPKVTCICGRRTLDFLKCTLLKNCIFQQYGINSVKISKGVIRRLNLRKISAMMKTLKTTTHSNDEGVTRIPLVTLIKYHYNYDTRGQHEHRYSVANS